jgi:putative PIN family toxin of toxin-antitoxin system
MPKRKLRVIIDTNLWISFLLGRDMSKVDHLFSNASILLLFSQELLDEFIEVASRPKFKKYFALSDLQELLQQIRSHAEFIDVSSVVTLSRDLKDNFLLALAIDGKAHFLLTGDRDLLILKKIGRTRIMTRADFLATKT